jgi:hypothetical protein
MMIRHSVALLAFAVTTFSAWTAASANCTQYPLPDGLSVQMTPKGLKIMSTATVAVAMDDVDEVLEAMKEAELSAKTGITKYFTETIQSAEAVDKSVETQITIVGENKDVAKKTLKKQMTSMRNSARELFKGLQRIGDCYTKGELVKVTVGMKPDSIAAAIEGKELVNQEAESSGSNASVDGDGSSGSGLTGVDGFSNTKGISDF